MLRKCSHYITQRAAGFREIILTQELAPATAALSSFKPFHAPDARQIDDSEMQRAAIKTPHISCDTNLQQKQRKINSQGAGESEEEDEGTHLTCRGDFRYFLQSRYREGKFDLRGVETVPQLVPDVFYDVTSLLHIHH